MGVVSALYSKLKHYVHVICNVLFVELLIKLKNYLTRVRQLYTVKMRTTFAGDLADLLLA